MKKLLLIFVPVVGLLVGCNGLDRIMRIPSHNHKKDDIAAPTPTPTPDPNVRTLDCCKSKLSLGTQLLCLELKDQPGFEIRQTDGILLKATCMPDNFGQ